MSLRFLSLGLLPLTLLLLLSVGIGLILMGRRGGTGHPACLGCGYDVTGSVGKTDRCPECGELFTDVGIAASRNPRRPVMMGFGIAIVAVCLTCLLGIVGYSLFAGSRSAMPAPAAVPSAPAPAETPPPPAGDPISP